MNGMDGRLGTLCYGSAGGGGTAGDREANLWLGVGI
jgi:hypothetical protein